MFPLSALVKIMFWLSWQNCLVELCIWIRLSSITFFADLLFRNLWNWWVAVLWIEIWLLVLWNTVLLSISLINSCMVIFLFKWIGRQNLSPNWSRVESWRITVIDKLINHLLLICSKGFFVLLMNFLKSTVILISSKFVCVLCICSIAHIFMSFTHKMILYYFSYPQMRVSEGKEASWSNLIIAIFFLSLKMLPHLKRQSNSSSSIFGFFR